MVAVAIGSRWIIIALLAHLYALLLVSSVESILHGSVHALGHSHSLKAVLDGRAGDLELDDTTREKLTLLVASSPQKTAINTSLLQVHHEPPTTTTTTTTTSNGKQLLGLSKELIISYAALISLFLLVASLVLRWTAPIMIEGAVISIVAWILYDVIFSGQCLYCGGSGGGGIETASPAPFFFSVFYSVLWIYTLLANYLADNRNTLLAYSFLISAALLFFILLLLPTPCNVFRHHSVATVFLKITLFSIVWILNRNLRIAETVLLRFYRSGIDLPKGTSVPRPRRVFELLDAMMTTTGILHRLPPVSWKHRIYSEKWHFFMDAIRSVWILFVCPIFLFVTVPQLAWLAFNLYGTYWDVKRMQDVKNDALFVASMTRQQHALHLLRRSTAVTGIRGGGSGSAASTGSRTIV